MSRWILLLPASVFPVRSLPPEYTGWHLQGCAPVPRVPRELFSVQHSGAAVHITVRVLFGGERRVDWPALGRTWKRATLGEPNHLVTDDGIDGRVTGRAKARGHLGDAVQGGLEAGRKAADNQGIRHVGSVVGGANQEGRGLHLA